MLKKRFSNQLTQLIDEDGQNTDLETVLSHPLLSTTVRNDAKSIIDYFFYTDTENVQNTNKYFNELVRLALGITDYNQEQADQIPYLYNRNAANVLSSGSKQIYIKGSTSEDQFIFKSLRSFISSPKNTDPLFAGNFARLFIKWYQKSPDDFGENDEDDFSVTKLLDHAIENVSNVGYSDLLERFLSGDLDEIDGIDEFKAHIIDSILTKLRDSVGKPVENGQSSKDAKFVPIKETTSFTKYRYQQFKDHKQIYESSQQFTREKFRYPVPSYFYDVCQTPILSVKILPPPSQQSLDSILQYLLIAALWSSAYENPTIFDFIVESDQHHKFIEKLLTIGIFGCENTMLCSTVFKILNIIVNGSPSIDIQPLRERCSQEKWVEYSKLLQQYVDYINYDPENVSTLAVFSFPIFWNLKCSRYPVKPEDSIKVSKFVASSSKRNADGQIRKKTQTFRTNSDYLMPIQILVPAVFSEPPLSTELNTYYIEALTNFRKQRLALDLPLSEWYIIDSDKEDPANEKNWTRSVELDKLFLDLVTFKFQNKKSNTPGDLTEPLRLLQMLEKYFPINPHVYEFEDCELKKKEEAAFPVINNNFFRLTEFFDSSLNKFFEIPDNPHLPYQYMKPRISKENGNDFLTIPNFTQVQNISYQDKDFPTTYAGFFNIPNQESEKGITYLTTQFDVSYSLYHKIYEDSKRFKHSAPQLAVDEHHKLLTVDENPPPNSEPDQLWPRK